jgi:hypothetical protein
MAGMVKNIPELILAMMYQNGQSLLLKNADVHGLKLARFFRADGKRY